MATEVFQLTIEGMHMGQYTENVLHFQSTGSDPLDTYAAGISLINGAIASLETAWLALLPGTYTLTGYTARRVSQVGGLTRHKMYPAFSVPGTGGSLGEAYQLCPAIFLVPAMGAKSGGKIFLPSVAQGSIISNALQTAYKTALTTFIAALIAGFTNAGITWANGVWSRKLRSFSPTTSGQVSPMIGYQKRRRSPTGAD